MTLHEVSNYDDAFKRIRTELHNARILAEKKLESVEVEDYSDNDKYIAELRAELTILSVMSKKADEYYSTVISLSCT